MCIDYKFGKFSKFKVSIFLKLFAVHRHKAAVQGLISPSRGTKAASW